MLEAVNRTQSVCGEGLSEVIKEALEAANAERGQRLARAEENIVCSPPAVGAVVLWLRGWRGGLPTGREEARV